MKATTPCCVDSPWGRSPPRGDPPGRAENACLEAVCYRLNICVPQVLNIEILALKVMVLADEASGEHSLMNGYSAFIKETPEHSLAPITMEEPMSQGAGTHQTLNTSGPQS